MLKKNRQFYFGLLAVIIMALIFCFSSQSFQADVGHRLVINQLNRDTTIVLWAKEEPEALTVNRIVKKNMTEVNWIFKGESFSILIGEKCKVDCSFRGGTFINHKGINLKITFIRLNLKENEGFARELKNPKNWKKAKVRPALEPPHID